MIWRFPRMFTLSHLSFPTLITPSSDYSGTTSSQNPYSSALFITSSISTHFSSSYTLPTFLLSHPFSCGSITQRPFCILPSPSLSYPTKELLTPLVSLFFERFEPSHTQIIAFFNDRLYLISTSLPFSQEILSFSFASMTLYVSLWVPQLRALLTLLFSSNLFLLFSFMTQLCSFQSSCAS